MGLVGKPPHQGSPEMATERPAEESHLMNEHFPSYQHILNDETGVD